MAIGTIYEVQHHQRYLEEAMQNTYHFEGLTGDADAEKLVELFISDVVPKVSAIQINSVTEVVVRAYALFDPADFFEDGDYVAGDKIAGGTGQPSDRAINMTLKTVRRDVGPGSKRYGGMNDNFITGNYFTDADWLASAHLLRAQLATNLTEGATDVFAPVIVKRVEYPATETAKAGHYMPREIGDLDFARVRLALLNTKVSSQRTRRNGR